MRRSKAGGRAGKVGRLTKVTSKRSSRRSAVITEQTRIVRLTRELAEARKQLTEAQEQQTATSEVLRVISTIPGDLQLVFDAMLEKAVRICEAAFGTMLLREGDGFRRVALHNTPLEYTRYRETEPSFRPTKTLAHILETMQVAHVADMVVTDPQSPISTLGGARTLLNVPMIKGDELIGVIGTPRGSSIH